jgi:toxin ParE1/3/4
MQVIWSPASLSDIGRAYNYIVDFNPRAAAELARRLKEAGNALSDFPERGRPIGGGRRELLVIWPYAIRYRITGRRVQILRVRHGAQKPLSRP